MKVQLYDNMMSKNFYSKQQNKSLTTPADNNTTDYPDICYS